MRLFRRTSLLFFRHDCVPVTVTTGEIVYRLVGEAEFPWEAHSFQRHRATYRRRFAEGGTAFIGYKDTEIVIHAWLVAGMLRIDELAMDWRIPEQVVAVYDVVTIPAWRGQGIYTEALRRLPGLLEGDVRYLWIYADKENTASLRGIRKAQYSPIGMITARRFAGMTFRSGIVQGVNA
ncbi:MAG: GNAT family N-acetyltransferase [Bacteroidetes bacterium]|nr:GNAT family N-acetyltransferase [Bacteroidota bacterium]